MVSGKTLNFHGKDNQILFRSVILAPLWTMNSRGKTWKQQADFKGNEIVRERGYMRVCTRQEGAAGGARRCRSGGEYKTDICVRFEDGFMIPQLAHTAGDLEKQNGNNRNYLAASESKDIIVANK